ncbi:MAG: 5-formyltetrahydrofolate cyclo-ligase [Pirellulaceae bacterium]
MTQPLDPIVRQKAELRQRMLAARDAFDSKLEANQAITSHCLRLIDAWRPRCPLIYVASPREVETAPLLDHLLLVAHLTEGATLVVPFCDGDHLRLFRLRDRDELAPGRFRILEPREELRRPEREISPENIDLALIPGVAFDRQGGRLGYGRGYFDRLLAHFPPAAPRIGLGFACQIAAEPIPTEPHDIPLTHLITEQGVLDFVRG